MGLPYGENFTILASTVFEILQLKGLKLPILPIVTLKPGSGVTQGH